MALNPNISRVMYNVRPTGFDVNDLRRSCSGLTLSKPLQQSVETSAREISLAEVLMKRTRKCSCNKQVKPPVLIITGYGVNCEAESMYAWEMAGARARLVHLHDLFENPDQLSQFAVLMFIGGFSFGDHMGSGQVMALRLRCRAEEEIVGFINKGNLVMGVCNGFQTMVKLGLLPGLDGNYMSRTVTLTHNDCGLFQNFWVNLGFETKSPCVFTRGLKEMPLPIRHGEGKIITLDKTILDRIEKEHCVVCRYIDVKTGQPTMRFPDNPNGSLNGIAGLCDPTGRVFGLMPHPEAYLLPENHPQWPRQKLAGLLPKYGLGLKIFQNAVEYLNKS